MWYIIVGEVDNNCLNEHSLSRILVILSSRIVDKEIMGQTIEMNIYRKGG